LLDRLELKEQEESKSSNDNMEEDNAPFVITPIEIPELPEQPIEATQEATQPIQTTDEITEQEQLVEITQEPEPEQNTIGQVLYQNLIEPFENVQNVLSNIPIINQPNTSYNIDEPISKVQIVVNDVVNDVVNQIDETVYDVDGIVDLYKDETKSLSESVASKRSKNPFDKIIKRLKKVDKSKE
jgi:adenine C2-methylase RlmN of 23S rRNA A2503 and tRNA A37